VDPFTQTNALPLSIAQVSATVYGEPEATPDPATNEAADLPALHEQLLAAVVTLAGELEAARWALDQTKAAHDVRIAAALSAGVPAKAVAEAAGITEAALARYIAAAGPRPAEA
jgi:hypothetical protein